MIIKNFVRKANLVIASKILVNFHVRYWCDCTIGDTEYDDDSNEDDIKNRLSLWDSESNTGLVDGDVVHLIIDPDTGKVENFIGREKIIMNFKVCDECSWYVTERIANGINPHDAYNDIIISQENEYVPKFLEIDSVGYGDYVMITIDEKGFIKNWDPTGFATWLAKMSKRINGGDPR